MTKTSLNCSVEEIMTAFESLDVSTLQEETLNNLLKLFPTTDQMGRFGASDMDPNVLKTVVELYLRMIQMPCVDKILHVALLKNQFSDRLHPLSSNLNFLSKLSSEAIRSTQLRKVLDTIPTSDFLATGPNSHHHYHPAAAAGPPPAPSLSNPLFQLIPDRGNRSILSCSPSSTATASLSRSSPKLEGEMKEMNPKTKKKATVSPPVPPSPPPPRTYKLCLPHRAHLVWNQQFVLESELSPHYTWKDQCHQYSDPQEHNHHSPAPDVKEFEANHGCPPCPPSPPSHLPSYELSSSKNSSSFKPPPPPPPPPSDWHSWTPQHSSYRRVARRHEPKELEMLARELRETEDLINASRIEYGYAKLRAAGAGDSSRGSSIMRELCNNLSKQNTTNSTTTIDLMEFCIDRDMPCLKDAVGLELKSWRQCQKELQELRTEFDQAIVEWKTSIRKCMTAGSTRNMMDSFISQKEQELQSLSIFLTKVRTSTENLFYHLEADRHKRRPAYLDEDEPISSIFLKFLNCFKTTASEIQLERQRALHLPKLNLLDAIFGADELELDTNHLKNLISFCPSEVQIHMFKHLVDEEGGNTEKAREKLSALLSGRKLHAKLKLLSVKKNFPAQAEKLHFQLTNLLQATKEILQSVELNHVVKLIPSPKTAGSPPPLSEEPPSSSSSSQGQRFRASTPPAVVAGASFRSASSHSGRRIAQGLDLKLLYQLRSKSLHHLVEYITEVHPELLHFHETLPHLESGTESAQGLLTMADDIRTLVRGIDVVESELKELQSEAAGKAINGIPNAEVSRTMSSWKTFLLEAEAEYESIFKLWGEARSQTFLLLDYFHENRVHFPVKRGFEAILNFVQRFQRAVNALHKSFGDKPEAEEEHLQFEMETSDAEKLQEPKSEQTGVEESAQEGEKKTLRKTFSQIHNIFSV